FSLVKSASYSEATRVLFWNEPHKSGQWSDDEDDA
ncbi:hypothetical protein AVEN_257212-1, partial [Araneus ventricosus]